MAEVQRKIKELFDQLVCSEEKVFPKNGQELDAPKRHGVYIILGPGGKVVHVGRTISAKEGLYQRLRNHISGSSSFSRNFLENNGGLLRGRYRYKFIVVKDEYLRAYLEAFAIGSLCPKYIGIR